MWAKVSLIFFFGIVFMLAGVEAGALTQISTCEQLQDMNKRLNGNYILRGNIDCSDTINWNNGSGFIPVGNHTGNFAIWSPFTGSFNGRGFNITDLFINTTDVPEALAGLFGTTNNSAIFNVNLVNVTVINKDLYWGVAGGLIGYSEGDFIKDVSVSGNIIGISGVGGLVGSMGDFTGPASISHSYTDADVSGLEDVGGLVGYLSSVKISNSYSSANVEGAQRIGGIAGIINYGEIYDSYSIGDVSGDSEVGGIAGEIFNEVFIDKTYSASLVSGSSAAGGLIGKSSSSRGTVTNSFWDVESSNQPSSDGGTGKISIEMKAVRAFTDSDWSEGLNFSWDFVGDPFDDEGSEDVWNIDYSGETNNGYLFLAKLEGESDPLYNITSFEEMNGSGALGDPFQVTDCGQLQMIEDNLSAHYALTDDIDCSITNPSSPDFARDEWDRRGFRPVGKIGSPYEDFAFTGVFDGSGYMINDLYINRPLETETALFGFVIPVGGAYNQIFNLSMVDITVIGGDWGTAGLVSIVYAPLGGITKISDIYVSGNVKGIDTVGGIVAETDARSEFENLVFEGNVEGDNWVGGLFGQGLATTIINSRSFANVIGNENVGGLIGRFWGESNLSDSYSEGEVIGNANVGGLIGVLEISAGSLVDNTYSSAVVSGSSGTGGLIGSKSGSGIVSNSFWDINTSGQSTSAGGTGKTTAEMQDIQTFTNISTEGLENPWDMVLLSSYAGETWFIDDGNDYPRLGWEL